MINSEDYTTTVQSQTGKPSPESQSSFPSMDFLICVCACPLACYTDGEVIRATFVISQQPHREGALVVDEEASRICTGGEGHEEEEDEGRRNGSRRCHCSYQLCSDGTSECVFAQPNGRRINRGWPCQVVGGANKRERERENNQIAEIL